MLSYSYVDDLVGSFVEGVAYTFGHGGGLIVYSFPDYELPDARRDQLAVGVVTSQRSAVLLGVVSGSSSDFIQIELVRTSLPDNYVILASSVMRSDAVV